MSITVVAAAIVIVYFGLKIIKTLIGVVVTAVIGVKVAKELDKVSKKDLK